MRDNQFNVRKRGGGGRAAEIEPRILKYRTRAGHAPSVLLCAPIRQISLMSVRERGRGRAAGIEPRVLRERTRAGHEPSVLLCAPMRQISLMPVEYSGGGGRAGNSLIAHLLISLKSNERL